MPRSLILSSSGLLLGPTLLPFSQDHFIHCCGFNSSLRAADFPKLDFWSRFSHQFQPVPSCRHVPQALKLDVSHTEGILFPRLLALRFPVLGKGTDTASLLDEGSLSFSTLPSPLQHFTTFLLSLWPPPTPATVMFCQVTPSGSSTASLLPAVVPYLLFSSLSPKGTCKMQILLCQYPPS